MIGKRKNKRILIVGASGFIGSSLTREMLKREYYITALIGEHGPKYLEGIRNNKVSVYPYGKVEKKIKRLGKFSLVFNFSGYIDIKESFNEPLKYEMNKPVTTIRLIEDCQTAKFINISTGSVYDFSYNPVSENNPLKPMSPYAVSQLSSDYYTEILCRYHKIRFAILRIFNPYGPPNIKRGIIACIVSNLLQGKKITLYNPKRKFDFTYIKDISRAISYCALKLTGVMNIGSGRPVSLLDVYKKIAHLLYKDSQLPRIIITDKFTEEVYSNSNKLRRNGFKFRYTIDAGLRHMVDYFKKQQEDRENKFIRQ